MPISKQQVKRETRVPKILVRGGFAASNKGRLKETESSGHGRPKHITDASQVSNLCDDQSRREKLPLRGDEKVTSRIRVPVVSATGTPLMPCKPARARELVRGGKAIKRFKQGIFYIKLVQRNSGSVQKVTCGIDEPEK
jgi:hypothetical protein